MLTEGDIEGIYKDQALAGKLYDFIIKDINPEISDDEARMITVEQIVIKTYSLDASGNKVDFDDTAKASAKVKADSIYSKIAEGADFEELMLEAALPDTVRIQDIPSVLRNNGFVERNGGV